MSDREIKRLNLRMGQELYEYYQEEADKIGVPVSSYMIMILAEHRKQALAVEFTRQLSSGVISPEMISQIKKNIGA